MKTQNHKEAFLVVAHGSRNKSCEQTMELIIKDLRDRNKDKLIELCFLEFNHPNVYNGLDILVDDCISEIKIIPYFLFEGIHTQKTIPDEISKYCEQNIDACKNIKFTINKSFGYNERIIQVLEDSLK